MNSSELKAKFNLPSDRFPNPIEWQDGTGFSVVEDYNNGFVSLYKIGFFGANSEEEEKKDLWVSVSYGKSVEGGGVSLGTGGEDLNIPIDLDFHKEFSYNSVTGKFYYQDKEIEPKDILLKIQEVHKLPTQRIKGFRLRLRFRIWRKIIPAIIKSIDWVLVGILRLVSGEKIKNDLIGRKLFEKPDESIKLIEFAKPQTMNFFGYEAKRRSVIFYCILHLTLYFLLWESLTEYTALSKLIKSNFLSLCYIVVSFAITEAGLPAVLKYLIKTTPTLYSNIVFKRLSISI